ncbi:hypothetical protein G7Y89_g7406 [Cudoniella acicularis]|uniref:FAD-binding domain-containing protein n=1 Tax=Cudoniella acicularis TaxID=354080 RepID=A0A8H4RKV2_9HELO|nr:hypothetical protein G7Y89_g7406 [Cudoniella acicularis]
MPHPKIAIIGAGPAGLTLARLLQKSSIPSVIYEAEPSRLFRNQGGTLDLHPRVGQLALKEAGLLPQFQQHSRPEGEASKILKYDGKWGKKLLGVQEDEKKKGTYNLSFADGSIETGIDLLVGADGAWSKVRPLLTAEKPFYAGITAIELWANDVDKTNPWLGKYIGQGSLFMFDEGRAIMYQRQGSGAIRAYATVRQPENWAEECGIDWEAPDARDKLVKEYFDDCGEELKRVVLESKDLLIPRKCWMMSVGVSWKSRQGVTLLGDAAHLMTPFTGMGVNVAMADALDLARALIARKESVTAKLVSDVKNIAIAVEQYEKEMLVRAEENAKKTVHGLKGHFSATGKRSCSTSLTKAGSNALPNRVHRRVILRDYGKPIYKASSRAALLAALEGCIKGHESLRKAGFLYRDILINNLMMNKDEENPSWPSFLIDLDLRIKEARREASGARGKTGTRAFIAIGALLSE